ncbi:MAG: BLUF domain-containing protein [Halieaceae bacterium]|nr:BLUF domain-containing protein [Halieaceae bacterium]
MVPASNDEDGQAMGRALYQLAYVSTATTDFDTADLLEMLSEARSSNADSELSGLLLHKDNAFFQVLEGPRAAIEHVMAKIEQDPRHRDIEILVEGPIDERQFTDWQMGFVNLDTIDTRLVPGFSDFMTQNQEPRTLLRALSTSERLAIMFRGMG